MSEETHLCRCDAAPGILVPHFYALAAVTDPPSDAPRDMGFARAAFYTGPFVAQGPLEPVAGASSAAARVLVIAVAERGGGTLRRLRPRAVV